MSIEAASDSEPRFTFQEIIRQPDLWVTTVENVRLAAERLGLGGEFRNARVLWTGAGTSAYAASAAASAWPGSIAVPTTDLLLDPERYLLGVEVVISIARSGDSPESAAVVDRVRALRPAVLQYAIVCNEDGALSRSKLDGLITLDPRTNDSSLVMTSAFSNLALAGLMLGRPEDAESFLAFSQRGRKLLPEIGEVCHRAVERIRDRIVILSSSPLHGWAQEAGLKMLEMTAGRFPVISETYLGLRHGPMSFVKADTFVLCLVSNDPVRRLYEMDLIRELRSKGIGYLAGITEAGGSESIFDEVIPAVSPQAIDDIRTPFEIMGAQLLGYHLSLRCGLNPDNPSPEGIINRVVQGVRIHEPIGAYQPGLNG